MSSSNILLTNGKRCFSEICEDEYSTIKRTRLTDPKKEKSQNEISNLIKSSFLDNSNLISKKENFITNSELKKKIKQWKNNFPILVKCKYDNSLKKEMKISTNERNVFYHFTDEKKYLYERKNKSEHHKWVLKAIKCAEELQKVSYAQDVFTLADTHYVFTHGQMGQLLPVAMLNKELMKLDPRFKKDILHAQKWMYHPETLPKEELKKEDYYTKTIYDTMPSTTLSADCWLQNRENGESAYNFLLEKRVSSFGDIDGYNKQDKIDYVSLIVKNIIKSNIKAEVENQKIHDPLEIFSKEFEKIVRENSPKSNLWIFAVPRHNILEHGYLSERYGKMASEWKQSIDNRYEILARIQDGEQIGIQCDPEDSDDSDNERAEIENDISSYQMRLFLHNLNKEGVLSFHVPEMSREKYEELKTLIKDFSKRLFQKLQELNCN